MKTALKSLACAAAAASFALLSCSSDSSSESNLRCKQNVSGYAPYVPYYLPDNLAPKCYDSDRIYVEVNDSQAMDFEFEGASCGSKEECLKGLLIDGEYVSYEEWVRRANTDGEYKYATKDAHDEYEERYFKFMQQAMIAKRIDVPCELTYNNYIYEASWTAMLTEEEIAELEKHDNITVAPITYSFEDLLGGNTGDVYIPEIPDGIPETCKGEGKTLVWVMDLKEVEIDAKMPDFFCSSYSAPMNCAGPDGDGPITNCGGGSPTCTLDGNPATYEEVQAAEEEYRIKSAEQREQNARKLDIPCSVENGSQNWTALLTEEEIAGLKKTYGELAIEEVRPSYPAGGEGDMDGSVPPTGCGG